MRLAAAIANRDFLRHEPHEANGQRTRSVATGAVGDEGKVAINIGSGSALGAFLENRDAGQGLAGRRRYFSRDGNTVG